MLFGPRVHIDTPDPVAWKRCFPDGLGESAFASPAFQKLMLEEIPGEWEARALSVDGSDLWLPVLGNRDRFGRWTLRAHPVGYDLMPVPRARMRQSEISAWTRALCTPRVLHFVWWLPAWHAEGLQLESFQNLTGDFEVDRHTTYLIRFGGDFDKHLADRVSSTMRRYHRRNEKHGVRVEDNPSDEQIDAYIEVYNRSYDDNNWVGERFGRSFFYGVARDLGRGGQLAIVLHDDAVVGGGVLMTDPSVVHYFQGAIDRSVKGIHPHVALYSHALRLAETRGIPHVNLGACNEGNEGLIRFKTSWGAEATDSPMLVFTSGLKKTIGTAQRWLPTWVPGSRR
ncbi:MAG: GNAT family N-acetyltransferase [Myxococcota bacterium]